MARGKGKSQEEDEARTVLRCDRLPTSMNPGKESRLRSMLRDWRFVAKEVADVQWRLFRNDGRFSGYYDPAADHRKASAAVRSGILRQVSNRFGLVHEALPEKPKKRLARMAPGFTDPLEDLKARVGTAQFQMIRSQVVGILESYIANRQNDFVSAVMRSSLAGDEETKHMLFALNKARAWFSLDREFSIVRDGKRLVVPSHVRRLARKIMSHLMVVHHRPSMRRIGMVVDQRVAALSESANASAFPLWLSLTVGKGERISIPLSDYDYFRKRKGKRKLSFQVNSDRKTGAVTVGVVTDVSEAFAESRAEYAKNIRKEELRLDFGLSTLFATDAGDLVGREFLETLAKMDRIITGVARIMQKRGRKPRQSAKYVRQVQRIRGYIKTELNRVLNRLVEKHRPSRLVLERLDFRSPGLTKRMNRILSNCGRSALKAKLQSLEEQYGVEADETASSYTSQTCSSCGYADRRNRPERDRFECRWCGLRLHADVNAARNVGSERFRSIGPARYVRRQDVLGRLVRGHSERWPGLGPGQRRGQVSPFDPRLSNPYFKAWTGAGASSARECHNAQGRTLDSA